jgi:hypothetical protein
MVDQHPPDDTWPLGHVADGRRLLPEKLAPVASDPDRLAPPRKVHWKFALVMFAFIMRALLNDP